MRKSLWIIVPVILFALIGFYGFKGQSDSKTETKDVVKVSKTDRTHFVYFTGIGCPHCANVDPVLLKEKVREKDLMVIEYEIYQQRQNAPLLMAYNSKYKSGLGVPLLIAGDCKEKAVVGDTPILKELDKSIEDNKANCVVLPDKKVPFEELDISQIPGLPKIWYKDRLAVKKDIDSTENETIKTFLVKGIIPEKAETSDKKEADLSGSKVEFKNAVKINGWILMYN